MAGVDSVEMSGGIPLHTHRKMISIKDIYQWDNYGAPHPPWDLHLTPLQELEWREQNSKAIKDYEEYKAKSFVGEFLMASPALIESIQINKITARATYRGALNYSRKEPHFRTIGNILEVQYELHYDKTLYETVRLIHNKSTIELEGEIIKFNADTVSFGFDSWKQSYRRYCIQLKLSGIKVTADHYTYYEGESNQSLPAELLDDKYRLKPAPSAKCFIATASFGNQDTSEVTQFREFRDNVLVNSSGGRLFITIYALLSPPIAYSIKQSKWLRKLACMFLSNIVLPLIKRSTIQLKSERR